jgi:hypothetical protein
VAEAAGASSSSSRSDICVAAAADAAELLVRCEAMLDVLPLRFGNLNSNSIE